MLGKKEAQALLSGDYQILLTYDAPIAAEFYTMLVSQMYCPCCMVQYDRQAFMIPVNQTRITVDSRVSVHEGCYDLFSECPPLYAAAEPGHGTLEVKYNQFLPGYVKEILSPFGLTEVSNSKYESGFALLYY